MQEKHPVRTLFQLPQKGTWFENIAIRPNGTILATALHAPEVWAIDPLTGKGEVALRFPQPARGVTGLAELSDDNFVFGVGEYSMTKKPAASGPWAVCIVNFKDEAPAPRLVVRGPKDGLVNGLAKLDDTAVLVADSIMGVVYKVDVANGTCQEAYADESMKPSPDASIPIGINGIKVFYDQLYFTNTTRQEFYKLPLSGGKGVERVASGFAQDDFGFDEDGTAYITTHTSNIVVKLPLGSKKPVTIAGNPDDMDVAGCTACAFGRGQGDRMKLYVSTSGALSVPVNGKWTEPAKVAIVDLDV